MLRNSEAGGTEETTFSTSRLGEKGRPRVAYGATAREKETGNDSE